MMGSQPPSEHTDNPNQSYMHDFGISAFQAAKEAKDNEWKNANIISPVEIYVLCTGFILPLSLGPGSYIETRSCSDLTAYLCL